jgi:hypothetical protein
MDSEDMTSTPTLQSAMGSKEFNDSPLESNSTQYIQNKVYRHLWSWQQLQTLAWEVNKSL